MSALADNPYMVDAQFQSDGWGGYEKVKKFLNIKPKSNVAVDTTPPARRDITASEFKELLLRKNAEALATGLEEKRMHYRIRFNRLEKEKLYWSDNFKEATMGLYECVYMQFGIVYQGHSLFQNINSDSSDNRAPLKDRNKIACMLRECSTDKASIQMWVPKRSDIVKKEFVLWRKIPNLL